MAEIAKVVCSKFLTIDFGDKLHFLLFPPPYAAQHKSENGCWHSEHVADCSPISFAAVATAGKHRGRG